MNRHTRKYGFPNLGLLLGLCLLIISPAYSATYYVRPDGGTATQCTGLVDASYPGTGVKQACAFNHPFWAHAPQGNNPTKMVGGDTLIIDGSNKAAYMMGLKAPNTADTSKCGASWAYDCYMKPIPSGSDPAHPTRILGKGWDTGCASPPQLWGNERASMVINLRGSDNIELQCIEVTDRSDCQEHGPNPCNRTSPPYGKWATMGLEAWDSDNVLLKNVNIHGMAFKGVHAGRLKDWTLEDVKIVANSFVGWDGDVGAFNSSNSGTMMFSRVKVLYNGCGETYPGLQPYNCYSQGQGGYGDGLGTHQTSGNWTFNEVDFSHNVSDGLDLLYHDGTGTVTVTRSRFEGNAGNQAKIATHAKVANSIFVGNCNYFADSSYTWNTSTFVSCRAGGNTLVFALHPGTTAELYNSTLTSVGDTIVMSVKRSGCNGTETIASRNNIFLGDKQFGHPDTVDLYYAAGDDGNGGGLCGQVAMNDDYSVIWATKYIAKECNGKPHSYCQDPKLAEPSPHWYTGNQFNVNLLSNSPARDKALVLTGKSSLDYNGYDRSSTWDIGALEYGSVPQLQQQQTCADGIQYCTTQASCEGQGYYWYNNTCNAQPQAKTCADGIQYCLTPADCNSQGYYWYNDTCNTQPKPKTCFDGIQYCLTQTDCVNNGHYWYNNTCNAQPKSKTCADGIQYCTTQASCEGQGYYWYNNTCNAQPQAKTCADGIQYCSTKSECEGKGYHWYSNSCHLEPKVHPTPQPQKEQKQDDSLSSTPSSESDNSDTLPTTTELAGDNNSVSDISSGTDDVKVAPVESGDSQPKSLINSGGNESQNVSTGKPGRGGRGGGGGGGKGGGGGGGGGGGKSSGGSSGGGTSLIGGGGGAGVPTNVFNAPPVKSTAPQPTQGAPSTTTPQPTKRTASAAVPQPIKGSPLITVSQPAKGEPQTTTTQSAVISKETSALTAPSLPLTDNISISLTRGDGIAPEAEVAPEPTVEPDENVSLTQTESETPLDKSILWVHKLWRKMLHWFSSE